MVDLIMAFREGGSWMYAILLVDVVGAPLVLLAVILSMFSRMSRPVALVARVVAGIGLVAALAAGAAGIIGWELGMQRVDAALAMVAPDERELLRAEGEKETWNDVVFGLGSAMALGMPAALALVAAFVLAKPLPPPD